MTTSIRPQHYKPVCRKMGIGASVRKGRELERWQERDINNTVSKITRVYMIILCQYYITGRPR